MATLMDVYNELKNNAQFRDAFKKNPEQALADAQFLLNPDDIKKIKNNSKFFEELDKRINK